MDSGLQEQAAPWIQCNNMRPPDPHSQCHLNCGVEEQARSTCRFNSIFFECLLCEGNELAHTFQSEPNKRTAACLSLSLILLLLLLHANRIPRADSCTHHSFAATVPRFLTHLRLALLTAPFFSTFIQAAPAIAILRPPFPTLPPPAGFPLAEVNESGPVTSLSLYKRSPASIDPATTLLIPFNHGSPDLQLPPLDARLTNTFPPIISSHRPPHIVPPISYSNTFPEEENVAHPSGLT